MCPEVNYCPLFFAQMVCKKVFTEYSSSNLMASASIVNVRLKMATTMWCNLLLRQNNGPFFSWFNYKVPTPYYTLNYYLIFDQKRGRSNEDLWLEWHQIIRFFVSSAIFAQTAKGILPTSIFIHLHNLAA